MESRSGTSARHRMYAPGALLCVASLLIGIATWRAYGSGFFGPHWSAAMWLAGLLGGGGFMLGFAGSAMFLLRPTSCLLSSTSRRRDIVTELGILSFAAWGAVVILLLISATA